MRKILLFIKSRFLSSLGVTNSKSAFKSSNDKQGGFVLITSLYNETNSSRNNELVYCLNSNLSNSSINEVVVLYDTSRDGTDNKILKAIESLPKVTLLKVPGRPSFSDCFSLAGREFNGRNIIVANSDIYFDSTLLKIDFNKFPDQFLVLSRYNDNGSHGSFKPVTNSQDLPNFLSADAWIFISPIKKSFYADYGLGTMYSDSFLNTKLICSGIKVLNPCLDVKAYHLQSGISESQAIDKAKQQKFDEIYKTEKKRSKEGELSTGLHWCFLPETELALSYNYKAKWTKKNIVIDLNTYATDKIGNITGNLNEFAKRYGISIWLYSNELKPLSDWVLPTRNEYLNFTNFCNTERFFKPETANYLPDVLNTYENVFINQKMIKPFLEFAKENVKQKTSFSNLLNYTEKRPKIYIHVQFGLSNRLRALASAFHIANELGRELVLIWEPDVHCDCRFNDLFVNHCLQVEHQRCLDTDNMDCYDYMNGPLRREGKLRINLKTKTDIYIKSAYTLDYSFYNKNEEDKFLTSLQPINQVVETVRSYKLQDFVGLHIRMGGGENYDSDLWDSDKFLDSKGKELMNYWRGKSHFKTFLPLVEKIVLKNPDQKFYLAADMQLIYNVFAENFGDRIIYYKRDLYDRSLEQQITALIDLYCLSKTIKIYGSNWSSFSEVASRLGNKEVKLSGVHF